MSPVEIADRLEDRFSLLTSGARTAEARQQTLRAAVDWSYDLLAEPEQRVFNRLSVFRGGWTLTAAEAVVADDDARGRARCSTSPAGWSSGRCWWSSPGATTRYRMLETLRQYAAEQLAASRRGRRRWRGGTPSTSATWPSRPRWGCAGTASARPWPGCATDQPNLRAALAWLGGPGGDLDSALAMAGALGLFWHLGRHLEGRELLARLLATDGTGAARRHGPARCRRSPWWNGRAPAWSTPSPRCAETAAESLELFEELGDPSRAALSRVLLAVQGVTGADPERSRGAAAPRPRHQFRTDAGTGTDADVWGAGVIGFVRMETALKTGDEANAVPIGRAAAAGVPPARRPVGALGDPVPPRVGAAAVRPLPRSRSGAGGGDRRRRQRRPVQHRAVGAGRPRRHPAPPRRRRGCRATCSTVRPPPPQQVGDGAGEVLAGYGYGLLAQVHEDWAEARGRFTEAEAGFRQARHSGTPKVSPSPDWPGATRPTATWTRRRPVRTGPRDGAQGRGARVGGHRARGPGPAGVGTRRRRRSRTAG